MKGLLIKDLYNLNRTKGMYLVITAVLVGYCLFKGFPAFVVLIPVLIFTTALTASISMDHGVKWDKLAATALASRGDIVRSKYILLFLLIALGIAVGSLAALPFLFMEKVTGATFLQMGMAATEISLCAGSISLMVLYLFKNMVEKQELLTLISYSASALLVIGLAKLLGLFNLAFLSVTGASAVILALSLLLCFVSYQVSVKAFEKRELA